MIKVIVLVMFAVAGLFGTAALISRVLIPDWHMEMMQERINEYNQLHK